MAQNIVLFFISVLLYVFSPNTYDETFILSYLAIFIAGAWNLFRNRKEPFNILSFNVIFLLSYFFCIYSYALFVIGAGVEFTMSIFKFTNFDYITRAVGLSTIAITVYYVAYSYQNRIKVKKTLYQNDSNTDKIRTVGKIMTLLFGGVIANFFYYVFIVGGESTAVTSAAFLQELYKEFLILYLLLNSISYNNEKGYNLLAIIRHNRTAVIEAAIICLIYIIGGDRGLPISIVFIFLGVYSFFYLRIKFAQFVVIALAGVVVLFALRVTRGSDNSLSEGGVSAVALSTQEALASQSAILMFSDLMSTSSEMCLGYEYVQTKGLATPGKIILVPFQPFPFMPTIVGKLFFGKTPLELSASSVIRNFVDDSYGYAPYNGNHIVIDVYIHWGIIGVFIIFFLFGRFICYVERNKYSSVFAASIFLVALSYALYLPRDSVFTLLRPICFLWFFIHILKLNTSRIL